MDKDEIIEIRESLSKLCEPWDSITHETIEFLGKEAALHIVEYHGENWIDIAAEWIPAKYGQEEHNNIVFIQFLRLFKETIWLQFLFQTGNYNLVYRNLRYLLEMMAQASYVDWKYPDLNLDKQIEKTMEIEEQIYGWNLLKSVLCNILICNQASLDGKYKDIWNYLNKYVHPSAIQMNMVAEKDPSSLLIDSFNETIARDTLDIVDEVFEIIYLIIFSRFPKVTDLLLEDKFIDKWMIHSPNVIEYIKK